MPAGNTPFTPDGDPAFLRVDTRRPAHELEPGVAADAVNKRFEDGRAWPRNSIEQQPWGAQRTDLVSQPSNYHNSNSGLYQGIGRVQVTLTRGRTYLVMAGNASQITDAAELISVATQVFGPAGRAVAPGVYVSLTGNIFFWGPVRTPCTSHIYLVQNPEAFARFNDPNSVDTLVLCTDDVRDGVGEDGGRGRAYRISSGTGRQSIPLNGNDVWGTSRLIPCLNGLVLLRQGNERHYFPAANVDNTNSRIQLNCVPAWNTGDIVEFVEDDQWSNITGPSGATPPLQMTDYFVKNVSPSGAPASGQVVELYTDPGLTTKLQWAGGTATGRFYLERQATEPGTYGNGAPPLIMQPGLAGKTAFEVGFLAVPVQVLVTAFDSTSKIITAGNHRLVAGDQINYVHNNGSVETPRFVYPMSNDTFRMYNSVDDALANIVANADTPSPGQTAGDFIKKSGASGLPMPPGREGIYLPTGRLLIANGNNNVPISDPLDPLHFAPVSQTITANLGEADPVTSFMPLGDDVVGKDVTVVSKTNVLLRLTGLSGASSTWALKEITREYGFIAPLATIRAGSDVWGFSRRGVVSVLQTMATVLANPAAPAPPPVSYDMKKYIDQIDWPYADQICAATWNNRAYIAVPLKGQTFPPGGRPYNNAVLVFNFLNTGWEGIWQGALLNVYNFARHLVYGEERLTFVNYYGQVCWLGDAFTDTNLDGTPLAIADELTTRIYSKGNQDQKNWLKGRVVWDTQNPSLSVVAASPGWNETQQVLGPGLMYDNTKYSTYGKADYNPVSGGNFDAPDRLDYSLSPEELLVGELDVHQDIPETFRMRIHDWGVQLLISNAQGSCRLQSTQVEFVPSLQIASRKT